MRKKWSRKNKLTKELTAFTAMVLLASNGAVPLAQMTNAPVAYAASTDDSGVTEWNTWASVKWGVDSNGTLWIEPASGSVGTTGDMYGKIVGQTIEKNTVPWYAKADSITSVRMKGTIKASSASYLFAGLSKCTDIDVSNLDISESDSVQAMFAEDKALTTITGLDKLNLSKITDMAFMFQDCQGLTDDTIKQVASWDTSLVTDMNALFAYCKSLTAIPVNNWNVSSCTTMRSMFLGCSNLKTTNDISGWNVGKVTGMNGMFGECSSLTSVGDLSSWNVGNVTDMGGMFDECSSLKSVGDLADWNVGKVTNMAWMFSYCRQLTTLNLAKWDMSQVKDTRFMFTECGNLTSLGDLSNWNLENDTNMYCMFSGCRDVESYGDLSKWNVAKVTNMHNLFNNNQSLESLGNLSSWSVGNVTDMGSMFSDCMQLSDIGTLADWNVGKVTDMSSMFSADYGLGNGDLSDLSKWDVSNVTNMSGMFESCWFISTLGNLANWNVNKVTDMSNMFNDCQTLKSLDLSNWKVDNSVNVNQMFDSDYLEKIVLGKNFTIANTDVSLSDTYKHDEYTGRWSKTDGTDGMSANELMGLTGKEHDASGKENGKTLTAEDRAGTWVWERGYTLTVDPNGSSSTAKNYIAAIASDQIYGTDSATVNVTDPGYIRTGYKEDGANSDKDGKGTTYSYPATIKLTSDKTIYAQWLFNGYRITYDANGGNGSMSDTILDKGDTVALPKNTFTRDGYAFDSWNTEKNGSGTRYKDADSVKPSSSMTLYAQWTGIPYTVKFDSNGGSGSMDDETLTYGTDQALSKNKFTKSMYAFKCWNTKADGSGTNYTDEQKVSNLSSSGKTITLYAQWTYNGYEISYDANGGTGTMSSTKLAKGDTAILAKNSFSRTGYNFAGWNTEKNGSGTSYKDADSVTPTSDMTLYAQWTGKPYTIKFDSNSGSGTMDNQTMIYGTEQALAKNQFTKSTYAFVGWNTKADGTGTNYVDEQRVQNLSATGQTITLYAQWKYNGYQITYNANGGLGSMIPTKLTKGDTVTLTKNSFTRTGYTFNGWNTEKNGSGTSYKDIDSITPTSDLTLYAQWKGVPYTVKFDSNGGSGLMDDQSIVYGTTQALSKNKFTKSLYDFKCWNTKADGSGTNYSDEQKVTNLSSNSQAVTLYAQWKKSDWESQGQDITKTKADGDSDALHDAGTYIMTIPTKILKAGMTSGTVADTISYDVNVTGNIPVGNYIHIKASADKELTSRNGTLDMAVKQGKTTWNETEAHGSINPDGSLSGTSAQDQIQLTGTSQASSVYSGLVTYTSSMDNSEKEPASDETSYGDFQITSQDKHAVETYSGSKQEGYTAGTTLKSGLTGTSYQWSINGTIVGTSSMYTVTDVDLKRGEANGSFQSNKLECTVTTSSGTKKKAYVYLAVPLTYSNKTNVVLKRSLTDNGNIATEGGATGWSSTNWRLPAGAVSFKADDTFYPNSMTLFAYNARSTLTTFDGANIDTSNVGNMQDMFWQCSKVTEIDVSGWDVSKVDNYILAFGQMSSLTTLTGIESWDTSNATQFQAMFYLDSKLHADLSGWKVSKADSASKSGTFNGGAPYVTPPSWK